MSDLNRNTPTGDRRTVLFVILAVVLISAGTFLNETFFPREKAAATTASSKPAAATVEPTSSAAPAPAASSIRPAATAFVATGEAKAESPAAAPTSLAEVAPTTYSIKTDLLEAVFTNKGGDLLSLKLNQHQDANEAVNLVLPGQKDEAAFKLAFGGRDAAPVDVIMDVRMVDEKTIEFSKTFLADVPGKSNPVPFVYKKTYSFKDGEYLFGLTLGFENSVNEYLPLGASGPAYTLSFSPQIGPSYNPLSKNSDYRRVFTLIDGKKKDEKLKNGSWNPKSQPRWMGISGKYFVFVEVPELSTFSTTFTSAMDQTLGQTTRIDVERPAIKTSKQSDSYYFYFGPKTSAPLGRYDYADRNAFKLADLRLEDAMDSANILGWLEAALKFCLNIFYKLIPNYGVAIILVTILVKGLLFPLTKKGSIASAQMQEIQPKIQALQEKYKSNPEKLNKEMAEFYKTEGINPMAGCLPLLIQLPIFIAMYNLFNTHFDLRGAMFIPGWIPDLSIGETVWNFAPFRLPILGWSDLRILPIIYVISQLVYGKFTQQPTTGQAAGQMKFMMYGMPIVFFFILYDVPSGLLVYWIVSNLLTIAQQIVINDILKNRKKALAENAKAVVTKKK